MSQIRVKAWQQTNKPTWLTDQKNLPSDTACSASWYSYVFLTIKALCKSMPQMNIINIAFSLINIPVSFENTKLHKINFKKRLMHAVEAGKPVQKIRTAKLRPAPHGLGRFSHVCTTMLRELSGKQPRACPGPCCSVSLEGILYFLKYFHNTLQLFISKRILHKPSYFHNNLWEYQSKGYSSHSGEYWDTKRLTKLPTATVKSRGDMWTSSIEDLFQNTRYATGPTWAGLKNKEAPAHSSQSAGGGVHASAFLKALSAILCPPKSEDQYNRSHPQVQWWEPHLSSISASPQQVWS